jgi:hypothetical protein
MTNLYREHSIERFGQVWQNNAFYSLSSSLNENSTNLHR